MLDEDGFNDYCRRLVFLPQTVELIQRIRSSDPSRRVSGGGRSVCARYPSRKMGFSIQAESAKCELVFVHECEYDDEVLEYYDQPEKIRLNFTTKDGRSNPRYHTPDYLVLAKTWAGWVECKMESELVHRLSEGDARFARSDDGVWISPPGQEYAAQFGLHYKVWTPAQANPILQGNMLFLEPYLRDTSSTLNEDSRREVLQVIEDHEGIALCDLIQSLEVATSDTVSAMIAREEIYVDLEREALTDQAYTCVFSSLDVARVWQVTRQCNAKPLPAPFVRLAPNIGDPVMWNGVPYTVANVCSEVVTLVNDQKNLVPLSPEALQQLVIRGELAFPNTDAQESSNAGALELLEVASPDELKRALQRYEALISSRNGGQDGLAASPRSIRRWRAQSRQSDQTYGNRFVGLIPHSHLQGNRNRKLPDDTIAAMQLFVEKVFERPKQQTCLAVHSMLLLHCDALELASPSYRTFRTAAMKRERSAQTMKRRGARAAYQEESFQDKPPDGSARHGERPFEIAHLDHTLGDIELVHSETGRNLGRPWITKLTDAFSRRILAVYCTYDPPSTCACMMILMECVRRHRRLPETIITDRGREFGSIYYETLLATYGITQKLRPPSKPRHGSIDERLYRTMNSQFIHNLEGNTQIMTSVRQVTKEVDPKQLAKWTLWDFHQRLSEWCYSVHDQMDHPELGMSPREAFTRAMEKYGDRPQNLVPFDDQFYFLTLPSTGSGVAKVDRQRGVKIHYIYYYCSAFGKPENAGKKVPVRYDPFNRGFAYAYIDGRWERCMSQHNSLFRNRSHREVSTAVRELRAKHRENRRRYFSVTARMLGDFLSSVEAQEALMPVRLRDNEARRVVESVLGPRASLDSLGPDGDGADTGRSLPSDNLGGMEWVVRDDGRTELSQGDLDPLGDYG